MNESRHRSLHGEATSRLRMAGYLAVITALSFAQSAGRMVADTKFDLVSDPGRFLDGGLHLWDPTAAFGQLQNQAYGYAWPMGPFFWLGDLVNLPGWVVQRAWWSLLLCLAFVGIVRLAQRLAIGSPATQVVAGFAFVLTPRITTLLGGVSVEVWPMALAPWVLLPLVRGSERGSVVRSAALSALVVACCGGVNAVAVAAVLPLGLIWILTRAAGPRKWPLLGWWVLFTGLATAWWAGPLLVLGRYSPPFLDYIENATITTVPTGLARSLLGVSDWVAYFAGIDYPAGQHLVTTPFLVLDAAGVVALGLVGLALRGNPHQRFLTLGLLVGVALVGFGYSGDLAGWWAADRTAALDGALAPFRNLHKFDVVLRIPLVLGLAHALQVLPRMLRGAGAKPALRAVQVATALALVALALPWAQDEIAPRQGVVAVPHYWSAAADYLGDTDDGSVSLELPASAFGVYDWGNVHDDVLQGLAESPWAVRNVIPLAPPGNVVFLDAVTRVVESGHPSDTLASYLASNGVGRLVVRNDLDRFQTGTPDPAYVRAVLTSSPGITLARSFGPLVGSQPHAHHDGTRLVTGSGIAARVGSIDVYDVTPAAGARLTSDPQVLVGDPASGLRPGLSGPAPRILAEDARVDTAGQVLTDGARRRETNFAAVRWNRSSTMAASDAYRLHGPEHSHRYLADPDRWQTTAEWSGDVTTVQASSSQAYADALPPLQVGAHPGAALDRDPATAWRSARQFDPTGQWWQVSFVRPRDLGEVTVTLSADSAAVPRLRFDAGGSTRVEEAPAPGESRTYQLGIADAASLRITAAGRDLTLPGSFGLSGVQVPGLRAQRYLQLPVPDDRFRVDAISLSRDPDRAVCVMVGHALPCDDALLSPGEDGDTMARRFTTQLPGAYELGGTVSLRRSTTKPRLLLRPGVSVTATPRGRYADVAEGPLAVVDGDIATTWLASGPKQRLHVRLTHPRRLDELRVRLNPGAAASMPSRLQVSAAGHTRAVELGGHGRARLPGWRVRSFTVRVLQTKPAFSVVGRRFVEAPAGISALRLDGEALTPHARRTRSFGCGAGPLVRVGDILLQTRVRASPKALVRGGSAPFEVCGSPTVPLTGSPTDVVATPSALFRVDSLLLRRADAVSTGVTRGVTVARDGRGDPSSVEVPARSAPSLLTLPQNFNEGWTATLAGRELQPQRVDGWQQGWLLPAGSAGAVTLTFAPARTFTVLLVVGAVLVGVCALVVAWSWRRERRRGVVGWSPPLRTGRPGLLDAGVAVATGGLLCGWWGLAGMVGAIALGLLLRRFQGWSVLAALALLTGCLALVWDWMTEQTWAVEWTQAWSLAAVALCVAALAGSRTSRAPFSPPSLHARSSFRPRHGTRTPSRLGRGR